MDSRRRRPVAIVGCALAVGAVVLAGCTQARSGTPKPGASTDTGISELDSTGEANLREQFTEDQQVVNDYWNSDRLRAAKPLQPHGRAGAAPTDVPIDARIVSPVRDGRSLDVRRADARPVPAAKNGRVWPRTGLTGSTVGRLYSSVDGEPFVCSATVVNSASKSLVATAAHCVWDTKGGTGFAENVLFVPGDEAGKAPYGRWATAQKYVPQAFQETAKEGDLGVVGDGWKYDVAFLRMQPLDGQRIQEVVGAQGIAFGARPDAMVVLGYPALKPFDGRTMRYCAAPRWQAGGQGEYAVDCTMTPGFSGGPWFSRFDDRLGAGYVVSVSSTTDGAVAGGSELSRVARDLYDDADKGRPAPR